MARIYGPILLLVAALLSGCGKAKAPPMQAAATEAPATIRIGSWNMAIFGPTKTARANTMGILAKVAAGFDIMAMQEVGSNASTAGDEACTEVMETYLALVNAAAGGEFYAYVRGNQYAFIYRKDRLELKFSGLYEGGIGFTYEPLVAYFQVEGRPLDFAIITIHTRPGLAKAEIPSLATAMDEVSASLGEPDVLCLGDFNADGSYYQEGPGPFLAGFPPERYATLIPNDADTTVAGDSYAYDRMEISAAMVGDWAAAWGVVRPGQLWDLSACEGGESGAGTERALSDHYPIWADFATSLDEDH